jgi:hypothetical protein
MTWHEFGSLAQTSCRRPSTTGVERSCGRAVPLRDTSRVSEGSLRKWAPPSRHPMWSPTMQYTSLRSLPTSGDSPKTEVIARSSRW